MFAGRRSLFTFLILLTGATLSLEGCDLVSLVPSEPPAEPAASVVVLLCTPTTYETLSQRIALYIEDVQATYSRLDVIPEVHTFESPEAVRSLLQKYHSTYGDAFKGAVLVGRLPMAMWEFPWGETCPLPLYYEDLDGSFLDLDGNGLLDEHAFGPVEAPEIWAAFISGLGDHQLDSLSGYFDKLHSHYQSASPYDRPVSDALLYVADDWVEDPASGCLPPVFEAMQGLFTVTTICGSATSADYGAYIERTPWALVSTWVHGDWDEHEFEFDASAYHASSIARIPSSGGALVTILWGCRAGNCRPDETEATWDRSIAQAYAFGDSRGLASVAAVRSIGTERQEILIEALGAHRLGDAFKVWLDYAYDSTFIRARFPDDRLGMFVWDFVLYGDPFLGGH